MTKITFRNSMIKAYNLENNTSIKKFKELPAEYQELVNTRWESIENAQKTAETATEQTAETAETATEQTAETADEQTAETDYKKLLNNGIYAVKNTEADIKKSRVWMLLDTGKAFAQVIYSKKNKGTFEIKSNTKFTNSTYHEGWSNKYDIKGLTFEEVMVVLDEIVIIKAIKANKTEQTETAEQTAEEA